jgi:catechol 2,3-dioxygenase-like lactoylglutathione lyase family enzyme
MRHLWQQRLAPRADAGYTYTGPGDMAPRRDGRNRLPEVRERKAAVSIRFEASVILVEDIAVSRRFYEGLLGQKVVSDFGPNVVFGGGLSIWQAEHARRIIFDETDADRGAPGCDNIELYFEADDIDAALVLVEGVGTDMIHPIREEPWGQRTFRCHDPDGHIVEVAEPMPVAIRRLFRHGYKPENLVTRTGLPMEAILQAIGYPRFC